MTCTKDYFGITLDWIKPEGRNDEYRISVTEDEPLRRRRKRTTGTSVFAVPPIAQSHEITDLEPGTNYTIGIAAESYGVSSEEVAVQCGTGRHHLQRVPESLSN